MVGVVTSHGTMVMIFDEGLKRGGGVTVGKM